ncbi:ABC transporter permease [Streptomyces sp. NL15-2K]|uniref:ABC transporter permease n=1 Tax=Streptomyces sp. NL15-2K TaxID=376149 RepID=UPI000F58822E|nr:MULTISPECIES: ABC transporter permease [Actinomycetes]WKX10905.1 ABC transporter permease [Kutzneria buriramensis]GCB47532.1 permease component of ABC-type multidrug transport system [Streptomyces sp. NL15-2K]
MNVNPYRLGLSRGAIELRQVLRSRKDIYTYLSTPLVFLAVSYWQSRDGDDAMTQLSLAGGIGSTIFMFGLLTVPQFLFGDREDGTLLRLRGVPGAMTAYVTGKVLFVLVNITVSIALLLLGGRVLLGAGLPDTSQQWLTLVWVVALGIVAVVPIGAAIGSLLPAAREALGVYMLPMMALMVLSGTFSPLRKLPEWLQNLASFFPLRWIAQGVRSALLPDSAQALEVSGAWQHTTVAGVLALWAVAGLVLAPRLLQRMARRESGSRLSEREQRRMAKTAY